jgi:hypothetical protein
MCYNVFDSQDIERDSQKHPFQINAHTTVQRFGYAQIGDGAMDQAQGVCC